MTILLKKKIGTKHTQYKTGFKNGLVLETGLDYVLDSSGILNKNSNHEIGSK